MLPTAPPFSTRHLPAAGGLIGPEPSDFRVFEIPSYTFTGEGEHLYLRVEKTSLNSRDAIKLIAKRLGVKERDVGSAGMKDRHAITEQWFSIPFAETPTIEELDLGEGVRVLEVTRHKNKLRTGHLSGNRFSIRLVGMTNPAGAAAIAEHICTSGLWNGYDAQRFGRDGLNLPDGLRWAEEGMRLTRFRQKLLPSVLQSEVFNRYLNLRAEHEDARRALVGDVLRLDGSRSVYQCEDIVDDNRRLDEGDVHLTGPMFGRKCRAADGVPAEWEAEAVAALALSEEGMARMAKAVDGTRRDLVLRLDELSVAPDGDDAVRVEFSLPSGSYATLVIREFTRAEWLTPQRIIPPRPPREPLADDAGNANG